MIDFFDDKTQTTEGDEFFKSKASLLEDLANKGDINSLDKELKIIENFSNDVKRTLFRNLNRDELKNICQINNRMNKVSTTNIGSLNDLVDAYGELETAELESSYLRESERQKIAERRNNINIDLSKISQRVVKNTLVDLYYLAEKDLEKFYDLKEEYKFLIGSVYTSNHFLDTFSSRVNEIEKSLGLNSFYENLFKNVFDVIRQAKSCFKNESYYDGFSYLNNAENYLITNNYTQFYYIIDEFKDDLIDKHISIHLSNGFYYAEKHDEVGMNNELSKAKILLDYNYRKNKNIKIIETLCYKESLPWIVDEFEKEVLKPKPDEEHIKKISSKFKRYVNNLKLNSSDDFLFAKNYEQKLVNIGKKIDDNLKKYIF